MDVVFPDKVIGIVKGSLMIGIALNVCVGGFNLLKKMTLKQ